MTAWTSQHLALASWPPARALVIGGSLGGCSRQHLLRSAGWDAVVFELNPDELTGARGRPQHAIRS